MTTALARPSQVLPRTAVWPTRSTVDAVLLGCGVAYAAAYVIENDVIAASRYAGYDRMSQAVSELSATGSPTKALLTALAPLGAALLVAFGIGVWRAAGGSRALHLLGAVLAGHGVIQLSWLWFPMTSRQDMVNGTLPANDVGHIALAALTVALILAQLGFGAAARRGWFRVCSLASMATVLVFGSLTARESTKVSSGDPTPYLGLFERINIGAWLLWLAVLAVVLLRSPAPASPDAADDTTPVADAPAR